MSTDEACGPYRRSCLEGSRAALNAKEAGTSWDRSETVPPGMKMRRGGSMVMHIYVYILYTYICMYIRRYIPRCKSHLLPSLPPIAVVFSARLFSWDSKRGQSLATDLEVPNFPAVLHLDSVGCSSLDILSLKGTSPNHFY